MILRLFVGMHLVFLFSTYELYKFISQQKRTHKKAYIEFYSVHRSQVNKEALGTFCSPLTGHRRMVHWLYLCRAVGHVGRKQIGGPMLPMPFLWIGASPLIAKLEANQNCVLNETRFVLDMLVARCCRLGMTFIIVEGRLLIIF